MNIEDKWNKFLEKRKAGLLDRFPGWFRAVVVETNDPLQMHRVRFLCPELHNSDLAAEDLPWAMPAPFLGGKNAGSWSSPMIDDIIWVTWEKNHPYGPIYVGAADGSRRRRYPLESIYTESPLAVDAQGNTAEAPDDFLDDYLPKDHRPMSLGMRDRYGNVDIVKSVGFFPIEHDIEPSPSGIDAVSQKNFEQGEKPEVNDPDLKYMARISKYGVYQIQSDMGYLWKHNPEEDPEKGEFEGDWEKDKEFEVARSNFYMQLLSENAPSGVDQRRYEVRTRYGHKFEMRDVGWAQTGGGRNGCEDAGQTKTRGDFGDPRTISNNATTDERWMKWRTKGGHLIQMMDMGFHPEEDAFIQRNLLQEVGPLGDQEESDGWTQRDARQMRFVTRHGFKIVLDDRGSDTKEAEAKESPHGNGMLVKGRRSYDDQTERGFAWEYNEKDELNTTRWYSPKSKIIEMNDNKDYMMFCTDTKSDIAPEWQKLAENEFALKIAMTEDPEDDTYHLKLDKFNGYARLKTAAGGDNGRRPASSSGDFTMGNADSGLNQGIEMRDGRYGPDGAWTELVDIDHRGMWFSKKYDMGVWRGRETKDQYIVVHSGNNSIVIRNNEDGPVQIFSQKRVEIIGDDIAFRARNRMTFSADSAMTFGVGATRLAMTPGSIGSNVPFVAPDHVDGTRTGDLMVPVPITQTPIEPSDRGASGNGPFDAVDESVIRIC